MATHGAKNGASFAVMGAAATATSPSLGSKTTVAYLGPPSSYTHQATVENFEPARYELAARPAIIDVFHAVQDGTATYGVVPFENSSNGAVIQTLDIFGDAYTRNRFSDLDVCGEAYIAVHHCLLGFSGPSSSSSAADSDHEIDSGSATPTIRQPAPSKPLTKPKKRIQHITKVYSHPQAFGQSEVFLSAHLKGVERQEVSSTSRAAELVSQDEGRASAAISSRMAADVHGLEVLAQGIEDRPDNETRFLVLRRRGETEVPDLPGDGAQERKTLVSFSIDHGETGALSRVLDLFRDCGLNLTSINSRPSRTRPWHYTFFVEFKEKEGGETENMVKRAMEKLQEVTTGCTWHGSWKKRGGL